MNSDSTFENGSHRGRDAARLGALMGGARGEQYNERSEIDGSIPVPGLPADGAMTRDDYRRLRRGYERGISPSALERMGGADGHDAEEYEEVVDARVRRTAAPRARRSGRIGPIAMLAIVLTGLLGSLLLYAGGADYISGLFSRPPAQPEEDLTLITARPGADAVDETSLPVDDMTPGETMASETTLSAATMPVGAIEEVEEGVGNVDSLLAAESRRIAARKAAAKREADAKARAETEATKPTSTTSTTKPTATTAATPRKSVPAATTPSAGTPSGRYSVQVRATPDRKEADRIAAKLRAKGGANVQVVTADQNGATVYRVRFGAFGSSEDARTKAAAMGYENVWVVPGSGK